MMRVRSRTRTPARGRGLGPRRAGRGELRAAEARQPASPLAAAGPPRCPQHSPRKPPRRPPGPSPPKAAPRPPRSADAPATPPGSASPPRLRRPRRSRPPARTARAYDGGLDRRPLLRHAEHPAGDLGMVLEVAVQPHPAVRGLVVAGQRRPLERGLAVHPQIALAPEGDRRLPHPDRDAGDAANPLRAAKMRSLRVRRRHCPRCEFPHSEHGRQSEIIHGDDTNGGARLGSRVPLSAASLASGFMAALPPGSLATIAVAEGQRQR